MTGQERQNLRFKCHGYDYITFALKDTFAQCCKQRTTVTLGFYGMLNYSPPGSTKQIGIWDIDYWPMAAIAK